MSSKLDNTSLNIGTGGKEVILKIILLGDEKVGKTAITKQYCYGIYPPKYYKYGTNGVDFGYKNLDIDIKPDEVDYQWRYCAFDKGGASLIEDTFGK